MEGDMRSTRGYIGLGILLIAIGILLLLQAFGRLGGVSDLLWGLLAFAGGLGFLAWFASTRAAWWAAIPGFPFLGLSGTILLADRAGSWADALMMLGISLGF